MKVKHRSSAPVLIVGNGSSGTSILSRLLRTYLRISFGTESQFIVRYYRLLSNFGDLNVDDNLRRLIRAIMKERWFDRCNRKWSFRPAAGDIFEAVQDRSYRGVLDAVFLELAKHNHMAMRWGDKLSAYPHELPVLGEIFPDAKFIHLVRDGRDVALSGLSQPWAPNNIHTAAHSWKQTVELTDTFIQTLPAEQTLEVQYEELLSKPVATFRRLVEFLDINDENGSLVASFAEELQQDLMENNFDKWRRRMTDSQRRRFERVACDALKRHGYETMFDAPVHANVLAHSGWRIHDVVARVCCLGYWKDNLYKVGVRLNEARVLLMNAGGASASRNRPQLQHQGAQSH